MDTLEIGCCGAYCKTCREYQKACKGCKIGYSDGSRDMAKAKCKIKVCCVRKGCATCADCSEYDDCSIIQAFHNHPGYKYGKYKQSIAYIRTHGYAEFMKRAINWTGAYGKL